MRSLAWENDTLVDWVAGGRRYGLAGEVVAPGLYHAYPFDAAVTLTGSGFSVIWGQSSERGLGQALVAIDLHDTVAHQVLPLARSVLTA